MPFGRVHFSSLRRATWPTWPSQLISLLALLFTLTENSANSQPQLSVLLPSVFHWDANNFVYVTPTAQTNGRSFDVLLRIQGENGRGEKTELFSETARTTGGGTHPFKVPVPRLDPLGHPMQHFYVSIEARGHQKFTAVLAGTSDVRQIHLQTDKVFYRPEERVQIRALPLTSNGQVFRGPVQFQLLDPNGFRIFNKTNTGNVLASEVVGSNVQLEDVVGEGAEGEGQPEKEGRRQRRRRIGFLAEHFDLPKFLRFGDWRIVAFAVDEDGTNLASSGRFQTTIRVEEYKMPKFHVFLDLDEIRGQPPLIVMAKVFVRFAHGMALKNGELTLRCSLARGTNGSLSPTGAGTNEQLFGQPVPKKLLTAPLSEGRWSGRLDLGGCGSGQARPKVQVLAEVFETGTFLSANTARDWDPFAPGFEMIPLRPAYTERTQKMQIYLRLLSALESAKEGRVELVSQCISGENSLNGLNHSLVQLVGTLVELELDQKCLAYVLRARRQLPDGNFSSVETLVLPLLRAMHSMDLSLLEMVPSSRVDYVEGELLEAKVAPGNGNAGQKMNFALLCNNGREVVAVERLSGDRILVPITAKMRTGPCVLFVHGQRGEQGQPALDMRLLFVRTGECPGEQYNLALSRANSSAGAPLNVSLKARPDSLATVHAYDSRLEALLRPSSAISPSTGQLWTFAEFLGPEAGERVVDNFAWFSSKLLDFSELFAKRKAACRQAGRLAPDCPKSGGSQERKEPMAWSASASKLSEDCLREMEEECQRQKANGDSANRFLMEKGSTAPKPSQPEEEEEEPPVRTSGGQVMWMMQRPTMQQTPAVKGTAELADLKASRSKQAQQQQQPSEQDLVLRDFFPEIWLFDDFQIGTNGTLELHLKTPHSITEWRFSSKFWTAGRADLCRTASQSLLVQKDVFMDVDVFPQIYVNETVPVTVTVSAENLTDAGRRLAVCFRGLSPAVCGDVGREGGVGETDFTRIELTRQNPVQQKRFFVRFLRQGTHNLSFELRAEQTMKGQEWLCRNENIQVFDRIVKQIKVNPRVDLEEHYRQIVVYRRRKIDWVQPKLEELLGEDGEEAPVASSSTANPQLAHFWLLQSSPDLISYSQQQPLDTAEGGEQGEAAQQRPVQTRVQINSAGRRVFSVGVEFSKFVASFPPALSTELLSVSSPLAAHPSQLHRVRNRPLPSLLNSLAPAADPSALLDRVERSPEGKRGKGGRRRGKNGTGAGGRKSALALAEGREEAEGQRLLQGYSLPNLLKELAQASYELKSLRALLALSGGAREGEEEEMLLDRLDRNWVEAREQHLGNLLAELLTFSDCQGQKRPCGFGEFIKPAKAQERSLVLTSLATSLLCEQKASDEFVCGPVQFLAQSVQQILNGSDSANDHWGLDSFVQFHHANDQQLFMEALMVQVALDCSAYSCSASHLAKEAWKRLHSSFYRSIDFSADYDVRVIAALAYTSSAGTRSIMRSKLASRTQNDEHVPYWAIGNGAAGKAQNLLEKSFQKSSNVLVNGLALLAYTQNLSVYRYWKNEFDLEALGNWLIEQQDNGRQYENALDTFFATRALHQFSMVNAQRQMRLALAGTINANFTYSPALASGPGSHQFRDQDLPFTLAVSTKAESMELETRGESRLLMGVKVLMEKRKRFRRDPSEAEPISLSLEQRQAQPGFINQTVTIVSHSHLLRSIQIEHGLFTGFTSETHFVHILSGPVSFQMEPRVSLTAVHFVLANLSRETRAIYSVTLREPSGGYSPENLAPIAISALHHHLPLGQLIVLPEEIDFIDQARRRRRSISPGGRLHFPPPSSGQSLAPALPPGDQPPPAHFQMANSFLTQLDTQQPNASPNLSADPQVYRMLVEPGRQSQSEVVETVCLQNGVCTCAELSCTAKCHSCDKLSFNELCKELNGSEESRKFLAFFRIQPALTKTRTSQIGTAQYTVLENVKVFDWRSSQAEQPAHLTIWIRGCNPNCLKMVQEQRGRQSPRFLLIGDPRGLFDESNGNTAGGEQSGEGSKEEEEEEAEASLTLVANNKLLETHYLMRDDDRLMRSTDCQELFGKMSDEFCTNGGGNGNHGRATGRNTERA